MSESIATHPDQPGVRGITIEEVARIVEGRIKTAFAPVGNIDDEETARKASWVVNGLEKWGVMESMTEPPSPEHLVLHINRARFAGYGVAAQMTGRDLRRLPAPMIGDDFDLWQVVPGHDDELVKDDDVLNIADYRGGLRLYSSPRIINAG